MIQKKIDRIIIKNEPYFDVKSTLECGQVFRFSVNNGIYTVYSNDKKAVITPIENGFDIQGDAEYFYNYFDLGTDYEAIAHTLSGKPLIDQALVKGKGIHILKQDPYETLISFIISANNHIPRIKSIIERICASLGDNMGDYFAFPTPQKMASVTTDFYKTLGAGYRDAYLLDAATKIALGQIDLYSIYSTPTTEATKLLTQIKGVGPKVCDCILLFAFSKQDVFPVDTWIKKIYLELTGKTDDPKIIRRYLLDLYGEYSGVAQQYLFYGIRA